MTGRANNNDKAREEREPNVGYKEELRLSAELAGLESPDPEDVTITDADGLLRAIVVYGHHSARYYAAPEMLKRLFWWQDADVNLVRSWRDELVARGDLTLEPIARNCYSPDTPFLVACIQDPKRFRRFSGRDRIPQAIRDLVLARDNHQCLWCGATEDLCLDHIFPWSKGGPDTEDNLQTLCRSCNSSKGARV